MTRIIRRELDLIETLMQVLLYVCVVDKDEMIINVLDGTPYHDAVSILKKYSLIEPVYVTNMSGKCYKLKMTIFNEWKYSVLLEENKEDFKKDVDAIKGDWECVGNDFKMIIGDKEEKV